MLGGITVIVIVIIGAFAFFRWRIVSHWARPARIAGTVAIVLAAVLTVATAVGVVAGSGAIDPNPVRWISAAGLAWLATMFYLILALSVLAVVWAVLRIVRLVRPSATDGARRIVRVIALTGVLAAVAATVYGLVEASSPRVTHTAVPLSAMPAAFGPLRVALITDVHAGPVRTRSFVQRIVDETNAQNPDLVVLGGDLIDGTVDVIGDYLTPLKDLRAPFGVVAVTGNHEYYADDPANWVRRWQQVGVRPLINESVRLERGGATVTVGGVNDLRGKAPMDPDYDAAFAGVDPAAFAIAVAHEPLQAAEFAKRGADLQLSGHTHGGQLWPFGFMVRLQQPVLAGLDSVDGMPVYTSRGAGTWGPPVRVAAPPEIAILEITSVAGQRFP